MQELEIEARAAIMAEDAPTITRTVVEDGADRELRSLIDRANVGNIFEATLEHRATEGPEAELQTHYKLAANAIPLALLETRAVTPAPSDVGQNMSRDHPWRVSRNSRARPSWASICQPLPWAKPSIPCWPKTRLLERQPRMRRKPRPPARFSADVFSPQSRLQAVFFL